MKWEAAAALCEGVSMNAGQSGEVSNVWGQIKGWPEAMRLSLATKILQSLEHEPSRPRKTLADLAGVLVGDEPAPTDEDVARILEEDLAGKYGWCACPSPPTRLWVCRSS